MKQVGDRSLWSVERFEGLLAGVDAIVWEADAETWDFTFVSQRAEEILGYPLERWFEHGFWASTVHPDDRKTAIDVCAAATDRNQDHEFEYRAIAADGREVWLRDIVRVHVDLEAKSKILRGVMFDVTQAKVDREQRDQDHRAAVQSNSLLRATLESTADGILVVDLEGRITAFNRKFIEMWYIDYDIIVQRDDAAALRSVLDQLVDPVAFQNKVEDLYADRHSVSYDVIHFKDGRVFERYSQPMLVEGAAVGRVWSFRDVSERVRFEMEIRARERALRESEERFRRAFEDSGVGMSLVDLGGRFLRVNRELCRITGRDESELVGMSFEEVTHPDDRGGGWQAVEQLIAREVGTARRKKRYLRPDGSIVWGAIMSSLVRSAEGEPLYFVSQVRDISEEHKKDERLRALVQHSSDVICVIDAEGTITYVSPSVERLIGYRPEELIGQSSFEFIRPQDQADSHNNLRSALAEPGSSSTLERVVTHRDGRELCLEVTLTNLMEDPNVRGLVANIRDVTELKLTHALEEQLHQAQKMEAIARLAGGVSHDFNNLLTAILGNCELLLQDGSLDNETREQIAEIREAAEIGASVSGQLLDISRRRVVHQETIRLCTVIGQMGSLLRRLLGETIELRISIPEQDLPVVGDSGQLEQVILNLAVNARDAMADDGGSFEIGVQEVEIAAGDPRQRSGLRDGRYAVISATDTGRGMTASAKERIFDPFFTTKTGKLATGLGLSTVYQIVTQMGGSVTVESTLGEGSRFEVFLPIGETKPRPVEEATASDAAPGSAVILLVEDDDRVRPVLRRALESEGYTVIEATGAGEARSRAEAADNKIDILVTDIVMAGTNGTVLADEFRARIPGLRVVLISGYGGETLGKIPSGLTDAFLTKPFAPRDLLDQVARVLDGSR